MLNLKNLAKIGLYHVLFIKIFTLQAAPATMQTAPDADGAIQSLTLELPQIPVMHRLESNRSIGITFNLKDNTPITLKGMVINTRGTTQPKDLNGIVLAIQEGGIHRNTTEVGRTNQFKRGRAMIKTDHQINPKEQLWIAPILNKTANLDHLVATQIEEILYTVGDSKAIQTYKPGKNSSKRQKIGYAIMIPGDLNSRQFRIPGLITTNSGALMAVTDIRYPENARDLPEDIDVGISISRNNGQTWTPVKVIMDMGPGRNHGVGDPTILVDRKTGRIFVGALYSEGNRGWFGSGPGLTAKETGQFMMTHSDDDGKTWSAPYSITEQIKKPEWHLLFNGPGAGIQLRDGTLVMPAQFKDAKKVAHSTIIYSKDHGKTWQIGTGLRGNTSESQVAQLKDGSILITARDENKPGKRAFYVTKDLGQTWTPHIADKKLNCPTCQASILNMIGHPKQDDLLIFANPARPHRRRYDITLSISRDEGQTWDKFIPVDERGLLGYSSMTITKDGKYLGLFYEGTAQMYFVRYKVSEL